MPTKTQIITELATRKSAEIVANPQNYMAFLKTAANNYKYDFHDQLLIYAQKPHATACAEIEIWNKLGRWVNKGSTGIALLVDRKGSYKLRHVFDVSDTNSRYGAAVSLWQMKPKYEADVRETLKNSLGDIAGDGVFESVLLDAAALAVQDNFTDYLEQLHAVKTDSLLEEL